MYKRIHWDIRCNDTGIFVMPLHLLPMPVILTPSLINPWRACAARVTVVVV